MLGMYVINIYFIILGINIEVRILKGILMNILVWEKNIYKGKWMYKFC